MKYVIFNDVKLILNKYKKYLLMYLILLVCFVFIQVLMGNPADKSLVVKAFGLNADRQDLLALTMFAFHLTFFIYIAIVLFVNDLKSGKCNLFLRISIQKWILYKFISIIVIIVMVETVSLLSVILMFFLKNGVFLDFSSIFIFDLLFIIAFLSFSIACYLNKTYLFMIIFIFYFIDRANWIIIDMKYHFFVIFFLLNILLSSFFIKWESCKIFEEH